MSRLDELIAQLCPDGVEYANLGQICFVETGTQLNKEGLSDSGLYPVLNGGISNSGYWDSWNTEAHTIAISQGGASAGYVNFVTCNFWSGAHCYTVKLTSDVVLYKYLYYFIKNKQDELMNSKQGAGIPGLNRKSIYSLRIPLPPLEVQEEIVRILDKFTILEAELEAELEAREKQYVYYRDDLLDFSPNKPQRAPRSSRLTHLLQTLCPDGVDYKKLSQVCLRTDNIIWSAYYDEEFEYIDLSSVDRNTHSITETTTITATNAPSRAQQIVMEKDVIFGTTRPTLKRNAFITNEYSNQICSTGFCILRANVDIVVPKYIYYQINTTKFVEYIEKYQRGSAYPSITDYDLKSYLIPVPPLQIQQEIVNVLDRFEALVHDLKSGLPAEIATRHKQYEYYRDQLLTFKPK